jgi:hypothetical protein
MSGFDNREKASTLTPIYQTSFSVVDTLDWTTGGNTLFETLLLEAKEALREISPTLYERIDDRIVGSATRSGDYWEVKLFFQEV